MTTFMKWFAWIVAGIATLIAVAAAASGDWWIMVALAALAGFLIFLATRLPS